MINELLRQVFGIEKPKRKKKRKARPSRRSTGMTQVEREHLKARRQEEKDYGRLSTEIHFYD